MDETALERTRERELNRKTLGPLASTFEIHIVGVSFCEAWPGNLYELERIWFMSEDAGEPIVAVLIREPDNIHDANAIAVHIPALGDQGKIGHVPKALAARLAAHLDAGERWQGEVAQLRLHHEHPERPGLQIKVHHVHESEV